MNDNPNKPICLKCNKQLREFMRMDTLVPSKPIEGAITVCAFCATICRFDIDANQVPLSHDEILDLQNMEPEDFVMLMQYKKFILSKPVPES